MYKYFFNNLFKNKLSLILFSIRDLTITFIYNKMNISNKIMILILIYSNNVINIVKILDVYKSQLNHIKIKLIRNVLNIKSQHKLKK